MWIALGVLAGILFLLWLPVRLDLLYREEALEVKLRCLLFLKVTLYPQKPKPPKKQAEKAPAAKGAPKKPEEKKKGFPKVDGELLSTVWELLKQSMSRVHRFLRTVVVERLEITAAVGGADAGETAENCGRWAGAFSTLYALLQYAIVLRPAKLAISPNYLENRVWLDGHLVVRIRPLWALRLGMSLLLLFLGQLIKLKMGRGKPAPGTPQGAEEPAVSTVGEAAAQPEA